MTTAILARKMLSVKLCKTEFEKVKWLNSNNTENMYEIIPALKHTIEEQIKNKTCRLCLRVGSKRIFNDELINYVTTIKDILQIEIRENDGKPQHICVDCESTLKSVEQLKQTAEITQWRLQKELELISNASLEQETNDNHHGGYFVEVNSKLTRKWACAKCRRTFDNQEAFKDHESLPRCRTSTKCYVCETCGIELKSLARLKRHRLIHTGELHFSCTQCPYRGRTKYALLVHERTHLGIRPVSCPHCPATFSNSSNLASHKRRHLPPSYYCHVCAKFFKFKETLRNHLATQHSTAKPHICDSCGKAFFTRKMICRHERRIHNRPKMRAGILPTYLRLPEDHT